MKTRQPKDRTQQFRELADRITFANCAFKIWRIYSNPEDREKYILTLNNWPLFFRTSMQAHFMAMVVALCALYETRRDTLNLIRLRKTAEAEIQAETAKDLGEAKFIWRKVGILRNEHFAHLSDSSNWDESLAKAYLRPDDLKRLIELSMNILNTIWYAEERTTHAFNLDPSREMREVLDGLGRVKGSG